MKRILIILLLIITFSWLSIPEITLAEGIGNSFSGGASSPSDNPNRQRATGGRGLCLSSSNNKNKPLTPLIPVRQESTSKVEDNSTWIKIPPTLTTIEHPSFWFYVPEPDTSGNKAQFMLLDKNDTDVIKKPIPISFSATPGFFPFRLKNITLNEGIYHWFFTIICDVQQPSRNQTVEGWIKKVPVSKELKAQLAEASETQRIEIYFQKKIWHEFVDLIARKQQDIPNEKITLNQKSYTIGEVWNQILTEVGL